jgi:farnesyl-diphosphate farnesyltransferase
MTMMMQALLNRPRHAGLNPEHRQLLRHVSRSFDLSLRLLPAPVQPAVAIGYLLARATDTVADTTALPLLERQHLLNTLTQAITSPNEDTAQAPELSRLTQAFAAQQTDPHERALMQALPQCLPLLQTLGTADKASARQVLGHITQGQQLDMARFGPGLHSLNTEAELDEYTWLVAGCVGEFWTELCERHLPGYARLPPNDMMRMGRQYGMGLQRLNILRDAGADLAGGRCYWPVETLATVGITPEQLANAAHTGCTETLKTLTPLYTQWLSHTQAQLADGLRYAMAVKPLRLRLASALPALIGARTLALLKEAGPWALTQRVKVPRHEMRQLMLQIAWGLGSPTALARIFQKLSDTSTA